MSKLNLPPFVGPPTATQLNTWKSLIEAAVEKQLSRDGTLPNVMEVDVGMSGNDLLNVGIAGVEDVNIFGWGSVKEQVIRVHVGYTPPTDTSLYWIDIN